MGYLLYLNIQSNFGLLYNSNETWLVKEKNRCFKEILGTVNILNDGE